MSMNAANPTPRKETRFVAFYSHKGGVGRSMALCNTAYVLAKQGRKVLMIDLDLEAPGLHRSDLFNSQFSNENGTGAKSGGVLGLMKRWREWLAKDEPSFPWRLPYEVIRSIDAFKLKSSDDPRQATLGSIDLLPAGRFDAGYRSRLAELDWTKLYAEHAGGAMFEGLKEAIRREGYDYALIDSRTGLTDAFYVATLTLADSVVVLTSLNRQNIAGTRDAVRLMLDEDTVSEFGPRRVIVIASPTPTSLGVEQLVRRRREIEQADEWPEYRPALTLPYVPELALRENTQCLRIDVLGQEIADDPYASRFLKLVDGLEGTLDLDAKLPEEPLNEHSNPFLSIRSDYQSEDELLRYFVDPGKHVAEAIEDFMPAIVEGARGSGKTMLARNYAYETEAKRDKLREQCRRIGLYFRLEVDLLRSFDIAEPTLRPVFDDLFGQFWDLLVLRKALQGLVALGGGNLDYWLPEPAQRQKLFVRLAREMGVRQPESAPQSHAALLEDVLEPLLSDIRYYLNNPRDENRPPKVQGNVLIKVLVETLCRNGRFDDCYFVVLVDEYENFREYQQRLVNTRLKQSKRNDAITYKFFIRHGGLKTPETGAKGQSIQNVHDYRRFVLDEDLEFDEFERHAKQIVERHLENSVFARRGVLTVEQLLERIEPEQEAELLAGMGRKQVLETWVLAHAALSAAEKQQMLDWMARQSSVLRQTVAVVLINQGKSCAEVLAEFEANSQRAKDWLHNYRRGALFWLCTLKRVPKLYCGFRDMVGIAGFNIRYLLDQCHAVVAAWLDDSDKRLPIPAQLQSEAIRARSRSYRRVLLEEGEYARDLQRLIERLGGVFDTLHRSSTQSEPERNHFKLSGSLENLETVKVLKAAYQAAALRRLDENKQKSLGDVRGDVWQLHPRFAPMFSISWRRKKQLNLDAKDFETILWGDEAAWTRWLRLFELRQSVEPENSAEQMRLGLE
jgi:cellulose biosynthesis protein BcsQ